MKNKIKKKSRNIYINLVVFFATVFLLMVVSEITLRLIEPNPKYKTENEFKFYEYSDYLGWKNKPFANGTLSIADSISNVRINSRGLRDYEHTYSKPNGKTRIEFLGDSFTWGYGVDQSQRYATIFENEINKKFQNSIEVIDMGTSGYETDQEYLLFKNEGVKYDPDIAVLAYHNDATFLLKKEAYGYPKPYFEIENSSLKLMNVPVPARNVTWDQRFYLHDNGLFWKTILDANYLISNLKIYVLARDALLKVQFIHDLVLGKPEMTEEEYMKKALKVIDLILLDSKKIADKNHAKFIVLLIPDKNQVYGSQKTTEIDHIVEFARNNNIHLINMLPDLREIAKQNKNLYFDIDGHFSIEGNEIFGKLLAEKFIQNKIIT